MGNHRMFAKTICLSDSFIDLPTSTRCLYFSLGLLADDEGFIDNPKSIVRQIAASSDDLTMLVAKRYVIMFESGVLCIRHWKVNNRIRADRFVPTAFKEERNMVDILPDGTYELKSAIPNDNQVTTKCQPNATDPHPQDKLSKDKLSKDNIYIDQPTLEALETFIKENEFNVNADTFFKYYDSAKWKDAFGKNINWKQKLIAWDARAKGTGKRTGSNAPYAQTMLSEDQLNALLVDLDSDVLEAS